MAILPNGHVKISESRSQKCVHVYIKNSTIKLLLIKFKKCNKHYRKLVKKNLKFTQYTNSSIGNEYLM